MPTDLPIRRRAQKLDDDRVNSMHPLLMIYATVGLAVLLLVSVANRRGMFDGMTNSEAAMTVTSIPYLPDGIVTTWASAAAP
jgi:hypothetical protein